MDASQFDHIGNETNYRTITPEEKTLFAKIKESIREVVSIQKRYESNFLYSMDQKLNSYKAIFNRIVLLAPVSKPQIKLLELIERIVKMHAITAKRFTLPSQPIGLSVRPAWSESCKCEGETECTLCGLFQRKHAHLTTMHKRMVYSHLALKKKFPTVRYDIFNEAQEFIFDRTSITPSLICRTKEIIFKKVLVLY